MVSRFPHRVGDDVDEPVAEACRRKNQDHWRRRRLLQRQLHDGAALRISALTLRLGLLEHRAAPDGHAVQGCIGELQDELHAVLEELRDVAAKIYPPLLDEAGLGPALREVAAALQAPVTVVASEERFGPAAEGAAYFATMQCLAAQPAEAQSMKVVVRREDDTLMLSVSGIAACHAELMDEARPLGGTVEVITESPPGASTVIARIPCE
ncbi:MAG TPA: histidine kinase [Pseudonocardiaceae bacterium]|jgi:signal transduction histidine kinase|nr:histidine kinase [Pseudonocardiaceae bacterium]